MLRIGLCGAGEMGRVHNLCFQALAKSHNLQLTAVADMRADKCRDAARLWNGVALYKDGLDMIESEDLDIVDICSPTFLHAEQARKAMERGAHVFLEKPVCLSAREGDMLLDTQRQTGCNVMAGHVVRFFPEYAYLKSAHEQSMFGELNSLVLQRLSARVNGAWNEWFREAELSGSVILDLHIHDADFVRWLLGEPYSVEVHARKRGGLFEQIITQYHYDGPFVSAEAVWDYAPGFPFEMAYRASFDRATVTYRSTTTPSLLLYHSDGRTESPAPDFTDALTSGMPDKEIHRGLWPYLAELKYFVEQVASGKAIELSTLEEGVKTVGLVLAEAAQAERKWLKQTG